jgi:hypothetical protein
MIRIHLSKEGDEMQSIISPLRTLHKSADELQDLIYDHKELERKKRESINADFSVRKSIAEYKYFKGLEAKSFVVFQIFSLLVTSLLFGILYDFFDQQILSLLTALVLGTGINIWFVLVYKPYKVEEWYMAGLLFYGLLLAGFGTFLFAYLSVVFFLDTGSFLLILLSLLNINMVISLLIGAIFPITFMILDKRAIKHPLLNASVEELQRLKEEEINQMEKELKVLDIKIKKLEETLEKMTIIPSQYKGTKTIKVLIQYFEDKQVKSIEEALELYDLEEQDALRRMTMIRVKK